MNKIPEIQLEPKKKKVKSKPNEESNDTVIKHEYEEWRRRIRMDYDQTGIEPFLNLSSTTDDLMDINNDDYDLVTEIALTNSTRLYNASSTGTSTPRRSRVAAYRDKLRGVDGGLLRLNEMQRRQVAERLTRRGIHKIFDWIESTYLFRLVYHYAKRFHTGNDRQYGYSMRRINDYDDSFRINNPYYYRSYNPNATYSRHESLIRSLVDRWVAFKERISSSTGHIDHEKEDTRMAIDMADRIERYAFQQARKSRRDRYEQNYSRNNNNNIYVSLRYRLWLIWRAILRFIAGIFGIV
jgi:hypothetical protein